MVRVMTSGNLVGVMVRTVEQNARAVFDCHSRGNISNVHHPQEYGCFNQDHGQAMCCMVGESTPCIQT